MAHHTLRLEMRRHRTLFRRRRGDPWEVRVTRADDGQEAARVPAGSTVYDAGRLHGQMCEDIRHLSENDFLHKYGQRGGRLGA